MYKNMYTNLPKEVMAYPAMYPNGAEINKIELIKGLFTGRNHFKDTFGGACVEQALPKDAITLPTITE